MGEPRRYRPDDLRRFAAALAAKLGVAPARASALATQLLWFDAAAAYDLGIRTLPELLERLSSGATDPRAEGKVVAERSGALVFDAEGGVPLLALDRAAGLAGEKARDVGVGLVRVLNVGPVGSAAGVAAELAVGPTAAAVVGPGGACALAMPGAGGLPTVFDPALAFPSNAASVPRGAKPARAAKARPGRDAVMGLFAGVLAGEGGWLVAAVSLPSFEPLAAFPQRVAAALIGLDASDGLLLPGPWEDFRREAREAGLPVPPREWDTLKEWAGRLGVEPPESRR